MEELPVEHAIQLIRPVVKEDENGETSTSFALEAQKLRDLLLADEVKNDEMIIISVTGAFRTGKSFLLNYLLLYLRHLESGAEGDWLTGEERARLTVTFHYIKQSFEVFFHQNSRIRDIFHHKN